MRRSIVRRRPKGLRILGELLATAALLSVAAIPATASQAATPNNRPISITGALNSVSCGSLNTCIAVGSGIVATHDAGLTWISEPAPSAILESRTSRELTALSCPTSAKCVGVGFDGTIIATDTGGARWVFDRVLPNPGYLDGVACESAMRCVAVGFGLRPTIVITTDGGTKWVVIPSPVNVQQLAAVSCPSSDDCLAVGADDANGVVIATKDGGLSWVKLHVPANQRGLTSVSCSSIVHCIAVNDLSAIVTSNAGVTWTREPLPNQSYPVAISCASDRTCLAVGGRAILVTHTDGTRWRVVHVSAGSTSYMNSVSCSSDEDCVAVGRGPGEGAILTTVDGGTSWRSPESAS